MFKIEVVYTDDFRKFVEFSAPTSTDVSCIIRKFEDSLPESIQASENEMALFRNAIIDMELERCKSTNLYSKLYVYRITQA